MSTPKIRFNIFLRKYDTKDAPISKEISSFTQLILQNSTFPLISGGIIQSNSFKEIGI